MALLCQWKRVCCLQNRFATGQNKYESQLPEPALPGDEKPGAMTSEERCCARLTDSADCLTKLCREKHANKLERFDDTYCVTQALSCYMHPRGAIDLPSRPLSRQETGHHLSVHGRLKAGYRVSTTGVRTTDVFWIIVELRTIELRKAGSSRRDLSTCMHKLKTADSDRSCAVRDRLMDFLIDCVFLSTLGTNFRCCDPGICF